MVRYPRVPRPLYETLYNNGVPRVDKKVFPLSKGVRACNVYIRRTVVRAEYPKIENILSNTEVGSGNIFFHALLVVHVMLLANFVTMYIHCSHGKIARHCDNQRMCDTTATLHVR